MAAKKRLTGLLLHLLPLGAVAQLPSSFDGVSIVSGSISASVPSGPYETVTTTVTRDLASTSLLSGTASMGSNATSTSSSSTTTDTVTYLTGSHHSSRTMSGNMTASASSTSSSAQPTNTTPCNNYPEFCSRKYSNITMIAAHNSPFVQKGSAAANQQLTVTDQLNDGVRFLQAQIQWPTNGSVPHFCHTTCDLLDAGPITDWLGQVKNWVAAHPYDVVTVLLGNGNYSKPELYAPFIEQSGITQYAYVPPVSPMSVDKWPTLSEMIMVSKRVVMFMDYMANTTAYPWLLDEFTQVWETPFDPTDNTFPCTVQRPPGLSINDAKTRLSLFNHNLNVAVNLLGTELLIPNIAYLNITNGVNGTGSLGLSANQCITTYDRPPNFLNVDYYNYGSYPGSVFEVAAKLNNVTYNRACCGMVKAAAGRIIDGLSIAFIQAGTAAVLVSLWTMI